MSHNTTEAAIANLTETACYQPGGTGILALSSIIDLIKSFDGDCRDLGRYSSVLIGNGNKRTRFYSVYGVHHHSTSNHKNSVVSQGLRYINDPSSGIDSSITPRQLLNADILHELRTRKAADERIIIVMDANEHIHDGDLCKELSTTLGLVELSSQWCGSAINTHERGVRKLIQEYGYLLSLYPRDLLG